MNHKYESNHSHKSWNMLMGDKQNDDYNISHIYIYNFNQSPSL